jgi:hypothetical protein
MDYFQLDDCPTRDDDAVCLDDEPEGINMSQWKISDGIAMGADYPPDAKWRMSDEYPETKLTSLLATVSNMLVVDGRLKAALEATSVPIEFLPFTLYNHKNRVASRDYFIVNVLGTFDCLHPTKSEIRYSKEYPDEVIGIHKHVLDKRKLASAPDIFRVKEDPTMIVISARLAAQIKKLDPLPTNVYLTKLEQAD